MDEIILSEMTTKDKAYKILGFILGIFLIYSFTTDMHWGKLAFGLIMVFISGYYKEMTVKKDGVQYTYNYFGFKKYDKIVFDGLDEVVIVKDGRNNLAYLVKGQTSQRLSMPGQKLDEMVEFIKKHSDVKIRIENLLEE